MKRGKIIPWLSAINVFSLNEIVESTSLQKRTMLTNLPINQRND